LQSFPRECEDKDMAAMLDDITKEANEESFVNVFQHGGDDFTCNRRIVARVVEIDVPEVCLQNISKSNTLFSVKK
jgi:hypothetical protein